MDLKTLIKDTESKFVFAIAGVLYYQVWTSEGIYQFPIDMNNKDDVGTTTFLAEYKSITLMRYIRKAMDNENLIRVG